MTLLPFAPGDQPGGVLFAALSPFPGFAVHSCKRVPCPLGHPFEAPHPRLAVQAHEKGPSSQPDHAREDGPKMSSTRQLGPVSLRWHNPDQVPGCALSPGTLLRDTPNGPESNIYRRAPRINSLARHPLGPDYPRTRLNADRGSATPEGSPVIDFKVGLLLFTNSVTFHPKKYPRQECYPFHRMVFVISKARQWPCTSTA